MLVTVNFSPSVPFKGQSKLPMLSINDVYQNLWDYHNKAVPFTKEEFDMVADRAYITILKKGEFVYRQGSIPLYGGFVIKGSLRHMHVPKLERREITTGFQFENSCFGDLRGIFYDEVSRTSLQALEETIIGRLDKKHYHYLFEHCKPFSKLMLLSMEKRCNELMDEMVDRIDQEAEKRYLNMLLAFPHVLQRVSQRHIASYLGIKPQSLSRIRRNVIGKAES